MSLTIFSGTFNPIHTGHLIIAEAVKSELGLDHLLFIPSHIPPHREDCQVSSYDRLRMVELAVEDNNAFAVSDVEFDREDKSYSYDTVKKLLEENPSIEKINFVIGSDAFKLIDQWYKAKELAKMVNFIIVLRSDSSDIEEIFDEIDLKDFEYKLVKAPLIGISSSYVRDKVKNEKSIKYLVPKEVEEYIHRNKLYRIKQKV